MKTSHVNNIRTEMQLNAAAVQTGFEMTELEYKEFVFNLGCQFIENVFPQSKELQSKFLYEPLYWAWWRNIYFMWELEFLNFIFEHQLPADKNDYLSEMEVVAHDGLTEHKFQNLLKIKSNGQKTAA